MSIVPEKLKKDDKVMIVAPSRGLKLIGADCRAIAEERLQSLGLKVSFAPNTVDENFDSMASTTAEKRAADLMTAFRDQSVKAILTVIGGFNSNQILKHLDYEVIRQNPKIFMGFSDITALHSALNAKADLVTYYGPHYSSLGMLKGSEYTLEHMFNMLFLNKNVKLKASREWSDDLWFIDQHNRRFMPNEGWWHIHGGDAEGKIVGGNLCTFVLQLGTPFRPAFEKNTILFIEDDAESKAVHFERNLQALINQDDFANVKGLVIGRFQNESAITRKDLTFIINSKPELQNIPVIANIDMGHTTPIMTVPLGGKARISNGEIFVEG